MHGNLSRKLKRHLKLLKQIFLIMQAGSTGPLEYLKLMENDKECGGIGEMKNS